MSIESFYITAAIELGIIPDAVGYGINNDEIISSDGSSWGISNEIIIRAEYLKNLSEVRLSRDSLLRDTDWVGNTDVPETEIVLKLKAYRQQLRDITSQVQEGQPLNIVWPKDPRIFSTATFIVV